MVIIIINLRSWSLIAHAKYVRLELQVSFETFTTLIALHIVRGGVPLTHQIDRETRRFMSIKY